jgi:hypothetical protein
VEARHPSALARVYCIYDARLSSLWFSLVDRVCSRLFCLDKVILYKKVAGNSPLVYKGFPGCICYARGWHE